MAERWLPVPGHDGYLVSDRGRVVSLLGRTPRVLRPAANGQGYMRLVLAGNFHCSVHQLVMLAFVGPRPERMQVRHLDGDPANNVLSNLKYGTQAENNADTIRHGRHVQMQKTECPAGHPYDLANTIVDYRGARTCALCRRQQRAASRARRRQALVEVAS